MAKLLNKVPTNTTEYPNSFKRQGAFPLEAFSVFQSLDEAKTYAKTSPIAYVGQPLAVTLQLENEVAVAYYVINNEAGDLLQLGSMSDNAELKKELQEYTQNYLNGFLFDQEFIISAIGVDE